MAQLVIVAIPSEDDYVWKLSSEKVPHMTILHLGDPLSAPVLKIAEFLEHAVRTGVFQFGLEVDRRGTLGPDQADVLFFDTTWAEWLVDWRAQLLKNDNIFKAYSSVPQYDEWTPHLTMGYPETPAHPDERDYPGTHFVNFDKIGLWFGDYQGVEYELKTRSYAMAEWSDTAKRGESLLHYGVKGMRWGVRKDKPTHGDSDKAQAALTKLKKEGLHSLSNEELRHLTQRLNLEVQADKLKKDSSKVMKGNDAVKAALAIGATANALLAFANSPAGKAIKAGLRA